MRRHIIRGLLIGAAAIGAWLAIGAMHHDTALAADKPAGVVEHPGGVLDDAKAKLAATTAKVADVVPSGHKPKPAHWPKRTKHHQPKLVLRLPLCDGDRPSVELPLPAPPRAIDRPTPAPTPDLLGTIADQLPATPVPAVSAPTPAPLDALPDLPTVPEATTVIVGPVVAAPEQPAADQPTPDQPAWTPATPHADVCDAREQRPRSQPEVTHRARLDCPGPQHPRREPRPVARAATAATHHGAGQDSVHATPPGQAGTVELQLLYARRLNARAGTTRAIGVEFRPI